MKSQLFKISFGVNVSTPKPTYISVFSKIFLTSVSLVLFEGKHQPLQIGFGEALNPSIYVPWEGIPEHIRKGTERSSRM